MGNRGVCQQGHTHGNGDAVVAAQGSAVGVNRLSVVINVQALGVHIDEAVRILFADHVQMALKDHGGVVFHTAGARAIEDHVIHIILHVGNAMLLGKLHHVVRDHFCIPGAMGDGTNFFKIAKYRGRLQTSQLLCFHINRSLSFMVTPT